MPIIINGGDNGEAISAVTRAYDTLSQPRLLVTNIDQEEIAVVEGDEYQAYFIDTFTAGQTKYYAWELPLSSTVAVGLVDRQFVSSNGGARADILWDYTIDSTLSTLTPFNQNNLFRGVKDADFVVSDVTLSAEGIVREPILIPSGGSGNNAPGGVSPSVGFRIYKPDTGFVFKVQNTHNASSEIIVGYTWIEFPANLTP